MAMPIITLTTDFGTRDPWVGIMKGVMLGVCPEARLVDLTHDIAPQDVLEAAMALESATRFFPEGTVHLAVVDPGVGGSRHPIAARAGGHLFVGPDNGLFTFALERARAPFTAVICLLPRLPTSRRVSPWSASDPASPIQSSCPYPGHAVTATWSWVKFWWPIASAIS